MLNMEIEEELERRKLEEALEVKSLRRIISAYLNYPEAAEEDVKRWERSFRKLPPRHKALLSHLPLKFQKLRWCIAQNSYFIFEMLKVFEPPLDMSQDVDICENQHLDVASDSHHSSKSRNPYLCESTSTSGGVDCHSLAEPMSEETCYRKFRALTNVNEEQDVDILKKSNAGKCSISLEDHESANNIGDDGCKSLPDRDPLYASACCNGNVSSSSPDWLDPSLQLHVPLVDVDKVRCIIRNIVRDWAKEGQQERDQCYRPILEELECLFPNRSKENPPSCLVPGAGLGRLALEISCLGFACQGNEFSYYMMICSSFILNHAQAAGEWTIFPWIHSNCNSVSDNDQLRPVSVPDIHPASAGITEGFSMCGGDFVEVYSDPSQAGVWDAVVTCFFLDTAHNIVEYIEIISEVLKDGGVWINLGPLLYHFADMYSHEDVSSLSTKSNKWLYVLYLNMDDMLVFLLLLPPPPKYPGNVDRTELGGCEKGCSSVWIYLRERINYRDNIHNKLTVNDAKSVLCSLLDDAEENSSNPVVVKLSSIKLFASLCCRIPPEYPGKSRIFDGRNS